MTAGQQQANHHYHQIHQQYHHQPLSSSSPSLSPPPAQSSSVVVRSLNAAIDRAAHAVLPRQPYLVSVPSDVPYRHSARFVPTWFVGTPFDRTEEQLQYLSFLPHQDEEEELLRVVGGWSDPDGSVLDDETSPEAKPAAAITNTTTTTSNNNNHSGHATPQGASARKKISLQDYNKVTTKTNSSNKDTSNQDGSEHKMPDDSRQQSDSRPAKTKDDSIHSSSERSASASASRSRSRSSSRSSRASAGVAVHHKHPSPVPEPHASSPHSHPHKKRKLTPPENTAAAAAAAAAAKPLPRLLSPTLPSPPRKNSLPDLLSPLLPPSLVKAITTPPRANNDSTSNARHLSPFPDSGSHVRSHSAHSARSPSPVPPLPPPPPPPTNKPVAALAKPATPNRSPARSPRPRQRHVIALKYGKKNRKRVEALLKFAPRPKKTAPPSDNPDPRNPKDTHPPAAAAAPMSREKSSDTSAKAKVAPLRDSPSQLKRPSTPLPSIKEPANASSVKKPLHATPKKEFKSTAMRRVESVEGADPSTPVDKGRGSTPSSAGGPALAWRKTSPGPTSAPHPSHEDRHTWHEIYQTYFALGRSIKHNATDDHKRGSPAYAVRLVEALLAFMISNAAQTLSRPTADVWASITDYFNFVLGGTDDFHSLHGLVMQLGAVCRQQIQKDRMERLARDPLPEEYVGSAPTPGSDGTTKTAEDGERYKNEYVRNRNRMIRNARELDVLWLEGSKRLSPELLKNDYPKTWQARRLDYEHRTRDRPNPALLPKGYFLPLDAASTPFEAVRYGLAFLTEWADVHSLHWQPRIDLDNPDKTVLKSR